MNNRDQIKIFTIIWKWRERKNLYHLNHHHRLVLDQIESDL